MVDFKKLLGRPLPEEVWVECPKCHSHFTDIWMPRHLELCDGKGGVTEN